MSRQRLPELGRRDLALERPDAFVLYNDSDQLRIQNYFSSITDKQKEFDRTQIFLYNRYQLNNDSIFDLYFDALARLPPTTNINVNGRHRHIDNMFDENIDTLQNTRDTALTTVSDQYSTDLDNASRRLEIDQNELKRIRNQYGINERNLNTIYAHYNDNVGRGGKRKRKKSKTKHRKKTKMRKTKRRML